MDYQEITKRVGIILQRGGFPSDEPLDSIKPIWISQRTEIPDYEIGAYSSVLADFGEWDRAEAVARSIRNNVGEKWEALAILAQKLAEKNLLDRAERVATSIPDSADASGVMVEKATALLAAASRRVEEGSWERTRFLLNEADQTIKHRSHADHLLVSLLGELAKAFHSVGERDRAFKVWDKATEVATESINAYRAGGAPDVDTWKSLAIIARDLFSVGDDERAKNAMALIDNDEWRERVFDRLRSLDEKQS